jgi:hypothetical protein
MTKVFRRPMFRKGGPTQGMTGIMSGIVDREMHSVSDEMGVGGQSTRERLLSAYEKYPDTSIDPISQLLITGGLQAMSQTGGGGTVGNLAKAFTGPTQEYFKNVGAANREKRKIAMEAEALDIEGDIKKDVAKIQQRGALDIKKEYLDNVYNIKRKEAAGNQQLLDQIEKDYQNDLNLFIVKGFDVSDVYNVIKGDEIQSVILGQAENYIKNNLKIDEDDPRYSATLLATMAEFTKKYGEKLKEGFASGGRVKYAMGNPDPSMNQNTMNEPISVGSKTVSNNPQMEITYDELRTRLPKEINDEVVKILSTSYEALADFAELRTQADVDAFNSRYGVNLILPQEA